MSSVTACIEYCDDDASRARRNVPASSSRPARLNLNHVPLLREERVARHDAVIAEHGHVFEARFADRLSLLREQDALKLISIPLSCIGDDEVTVAIQVPGLLRVFFKTQLTKLAR